MITEQEFKKRYSNCPLCGSNFSFSASPFNFDEVGFHCDNKKNVKSDLFIVFKKNIFLTAYIKFDNFDFLISNNEIIIYGSKRQTIPGRYDIYNFLIPIQQLKQRIKKVLLLL